MTTLDPPAARVGARSTRGVARPADGRRGGSTPAEPQGDLTSRLHDLTPMWHMTAIEHVADAIVVADLDGTIRYVNPAFERDTGLGRDCLIGQDVRSLAADEQPAATVKGLWAAIRRGEVWTGELINRRPDGTLAYAEATVAPIRDAAGTVVGGVVIKRDISAQRALETRLDECHRERTALAAALAAMRSGATAEATAEAISLALLGLSGFGGVILFGFEPSGEVVPLATLDRDGRPVLLPGSLPAERSACLRERASHGPWIEDWSPRPEHPYYAAGVEHDVRVLAYVPVQSDGEAVGLLVVSAGDGDALALTERLPALVECAAFAGALLGPQLRSRGERALSEARIRAIIADRAFLPVFQPIVELHSRVVVGYEALTRFADGTRPDAVFAEATRCGLALELEVATLEAVLEASGSLPASAWLNLNVSAELVLAGDDAGAGFASLRHILELRPDYVKLDRGIVQQIHRDPARQALVAGMVHFAGKTGAVLVAEGVETEAEARQLRQLGVALAQGYRLGRPALAARIAAPLATVARPAPLTPARPVQRRSATTAAADDIGHAVNIGSTLAAVLREVGVTTVADLRALGAVPAWERLRQVRRRLASGATLLQLEGATRGIRVTQLSPAERARLRLFVRLGRQAS